MLYMGTMVELSIDLLFVVIQHYSVCHNSKTIHSEVFFKNLLIPAMEQKCPVAVVSTIVTDV